MEASDTMFGIRSAEQSKSERRSRRRRWNSLAHHEVVGQNISDGYESPQATSLMAHSYSGNYVHIIFSTKDRIESIPAHIHEKLWAYLFGIARNLKIVFLAVGGTSNHVHVLISLPATVRLCDAIKELKANSSRWLGEHGITFEWQKGYGAFSVSSSQLDVVERYIRNQEVHHRKLTFEDELLMMLQKSRIPHVKSEVLA